MTETVVKTLGLSVLYKIFLIILSTMIFTFAIYLFNNLELYGVIALFILLGYLTPFFVMRISLMQSEFEFIRPAGFFSIKRGIVKYSDIKEIIVNRTTPLYKENLTDHEFRVKK